MDNKHSSSNCAFMPRLFHCKRDPASAAWKRGRQSPTQTASQTPPPPPHRPRDTAYPLGTGFGILRHFLGPFSVHTLVFWDVCLSFRFFRSLRLTTTPSTRKLFVSFASILGARRREHALHVLKGSAEPLGTRFFVWLTEANSCLQGIS